MGRGVSVCCCDVLSCLVIGDHVVSAGRVNFLRQESVGKINNLDNL